MSTGTLTCSGNVNSSMSATWSSTSAMHASSARAASAFAKDRATMAGVEPEVTFFLAINRTRSGFEPISLTCWFILVAAGRQKYSAWRKSNDNGDYPWENVYTLRRIATSVHCTYRIPRPSYCWHDIGIWYCLEGSGAEGGAEALHFASKRHGNQGETSGKCNCPTSNTREYVIWSLRYIAMKRRNLRFPWNKSTGRLLRICPTGSRRGAAGSSAPSQSTAHAL